MKTYSSPAIKTMRINYENDIMAVSTISPDGTNEVYSDKLF